MLEASSKPCKTCGETKLLTAFGRCDRARDGRVGSCNACAWKRRAERLDRKQEYDRQIRWRAENPERHKELKRAESKRYRARKAESEGREYVSVQDRSAACAVERERIKAERKAHAIKLRADRVAARPWLQPGLSEAERHRLRYRLDPEFHLRELLRLKARKKKYGRTGEFLRAVLIKGARRSLKLELAAGYGIEELRRHIERQFTRGMNWQNFATGAIHIDHIVPLHSFDLGDPIEVRAAWSLSNLRPMWAKANLAKAGRRETLL